MSLNDIGGDSHLPLLIARLLNAEAGVLVTNRLQRLAKCSLKCRIVVAIIHHVQYGLILLLGTLTNLDIGLRALHNRVVRVARTLCADSRHKVPHNAHAAVHAVEFIVQLAI